MFERRSSVIAFLVVATLLTLPAAIAAQSTATQEPSASTSGDPRQPILVGATLETYYQFNWNRVPDRTVPLRAYDTRANTFSLQQIGLVLDAPRTSARNAATAVASIFSSVKPRKPSREARRMSPDQTCTGTSGKRTARTCFRSDRTGCRRTRGSSRRTSDTRRTTRRTTRRSRARISSTFCRSTTRACASRFRCTNG